MIVEWISTRIEHAVEKDILNKKKDISVYVHNLIADSLSKNPELKTLEQVPIMGKRITETIERSISDVINNIIEQALIDLASYKNRLLVKETSEVILKAIEFEDENHEVDKIYMDIAVEVIEIIKNK